jgi:N-acetylmuramoyl-L-alanine amidase
MRSFDDRFRFGAAVRILCIAALVCAGVTVQAGAQTSNAVRLLREAGERESALRADVDARKAGTPATPLLERARVLVRAYEDISRLFPKSATSDDALWRGATLAADAFWEFGQAEDRTTAIRLIKQLAARFPGSARAKQTQPQLDRLVAAKVVVPQRRPAVTLTAVRREALPGAVRVTLELEGETAFREEQTGSPPRVTIALQDTRPTDALTNAAQAFPDDIVRQIRITRQNGTTRVTLNLSAATTHAVYALYNPYRVILDFSREAAVRAAATPAGPASSRARASTRPPPRSAPSTPATAATPAAPPRPNGVGGFSLSRQLGLGVARIVIDPGHGGHDPGAMTGQTSEAELALDIARRLEQLLLNEPGVEVVMTRRSDTFVALEERTAIANREGADLFLSIHVNASEDERARGIETYFLNFAPSPAAEAIAARENAASARTMRQLPDIVKAIALNNKIDESRDFASLVQSALIDRTRRSNASVKDLGVKQAPFMVLIGATMPSILAEISFLTNSQEAALLRAPAYRQQVAEALFAGVMQYQRSLKTAPGTVASQ